MSTINRTIEELKLVCDFRRDLVKFAINRTIEELKSFFGDDQEALIQPLIAP